MGTRTGPLVSYPWFFERAMISPQALSRDLTSLLLRVILYVTSVTRVSLPDSLDLFVDLLSLGLLLLNVCHCSRLFSFSN